MIDFKKWWPRWGEDHRSAFSEHRTECEPYMVTVAANHVSGNVALFDSEHKHSGFVALRVSSAERHRGLGRDWVHGQKEIIEIYMSHAQWAAMISTPNSGSGVPGTLQHILHERVDQPEVDRRTEKYGGELVEQLNKAVAKIDAMAEGKLTRGQKDQLAMIRQDIVANLPFVAEQFEKHMEVRTEKAKSDIEAHMNASVQRVGMAALAQSDRLVRLLGSKSDD